MSKPIIYLALGDSLTAGYGAPSGLGFSDIYRSIAEKKMNKPILLKNKGVIGARIADVKHRLSSDKKVQAEVQQSTLITITAGGNDMLDAARQYLIDKDTKKIFRTIRKCEQTFQDMLHLVQTYKQKIAVPYVIRIANLYNPFPQFPEAVFGVTMFNRMLRNLCRSNVCIADVYCAFLSREERLLSEDLIHPNEKGYRVMAKQMAACGFDLK